MDANRILIFLNRIETDFFIAIFFKKATLIVCVLPFLRLTTLKLIVSVSKGILIYAKSVKLRLSVLSVTLRV